MKDYLLNMGILAVASEISESGIVWIVGALAALPTLLFCANQAKQFFTRKPALHDEFRLVRDCDSRCQTANERYSELSKNVNSRLSAMSEKSAASREKLYLRVAHLESELSSLKKENELQTQHLYSLEQKLDRLLEIRK